MEKAYLFGALFFIFLFLLVYQVDLILFFYREKNRFLKRKEVVEYRTFLENKQKKTKHFQKKNFYLYLFILLLWEEGEKEKGEGLLPFLKNDLLLGIRKK